MSEPQQSFSLLSIIFGGFVGASFSFLASFLLRFWQYSRDNWLKRVDWFCDNLEKAADLGTEFWCERGDCISSDNIRAHRLLGLQTRLDGLFATLSIRFKDEDKTKLDLLMFQVRDALTGGSFMSEDGQKDVNKARDVQASISDLIVAVRRASDDAMAPKNYLLSMIPPRRYPSSEEDWR